ncbi:MAG: lytic murein transglycosylase [Solirubrobacterales bacterium]
MTPARFPFLRARLAAAAASRTQRVLWPSALFLVVAALGVAGAPAADSAAPEEPAASQTEAPAPPPAPVAPPAPVVQADTLAPPPAPSKGNGGVVAEPEAEATPEPEPDASTESEGEAGAVPVPVPTESSSTFTLPSLPISSCAPSGIPPILIPIYQRASDAYDLGPQGPSVLAAINEIETAFGTNTNISSAGAVGWMQFMPETWAAYGVDANGDGVKDPYNPEDAIFAAANYLSASGMPGNTYDAIYAYNHADWYVADVLANAECYGALGGLLGGAFDLTPKLQVLTCTPPKRWRKQIPIIYLDAFETAAGRYGLGERGVWALAAVARLESDFGRGMNKAELKERGPLGLEGVEWARYAVDGDADGRIDRADPDDSAATLARIIWSRGGLRAGLFSHNQAGWYVEAVLNEADRLEGNCKMSKIDWTLSLPNVVIAPINWDNLTLSNPLEQRDLDTGALDPRIVGLIGAMTQNHQITISSLRSDHSKYTVEGGVSNHFYGRAMDIAAVDGVSCTDTAPTAPCAELGRTLASLPVPARPSELIYCFDLDGPGPAFARADHCDHVHAGYDE